MMIIAELNYSQPTKISTILMLLK